MRRPRVLLADDHEIFLDGLERLLLDDYEIVGKVGDGRALVEAALELRPEVIVVDVSMPHLNGVQAARQTKEKGLDAKIVVLTMYDDVEYATEALGVGVQGYVLKHSASAELLRAIREVLKGRTYVTPRIAGEVFATLAKGERQAGTRLSLRQREVLQLLVEGQSAKEIAGNLAISQRTVEHHKYGMMESLGLKTSAELIRYAIESKLVV